MKRQYSCALITGASSGLGEEFALQLGKRVDKMVLVARRADRLEQVANSVREVSPDTAVLVVPTDLSHSTECISLAERLAETEFLPDLLINNAGLGEYGEFVTADWKDLEKMLRVNVEALTHLSHLFAPMMVTRGGGRILNVSSLASTLPIPDFGVYAATKAFVSSFSEALRIELRESGVEVMSLCPGPVKTEFGKVARRAEGDDDKAPMQKLFYVSKEQVVAEALAGLDRGRARVFPGVQVAVAGLLLGALPLVVLRALMRGRPRR